MPNQLDVEWGALEEENGHHAYDRAVVFRFHGGCGTSPAREEPSTSEPGLAESAVTEEQVLPFADVNCDRARQFAGMGFEPGAERLMGRVLARLMAHEVYHVLLNTREHTASGITKAIQTPRMLVQKSLVFEHGELERIEKALAHK